MAISQEPKGLQTWITLLLMKIDLFDMHVVCKICCYFVQDNPIQMLMILGIEPISL